MIIVSTLERMVKTLLQFSNLLPTSSLDTERLLGGDFSGNDWRTLICWKRACLSMSGLDAKCFKARAWEAYLCLLRFMNSNLKHDSSWGNHVWRPLQNIIHQTQITENFKRKLRSNLEHDKKNASIESSENEKSYNIRRVFVKNSLQLRASCISAGAGEVKLRCYCSVGSQADVVVINHPSHLKKRCLSP